MSIYSSLGLDTKPFNKALNDAEKNMINSAKRMDKHVKGIGKSVSPGANIKDKINNFSGGLDAGGVGGGKLGKMGNLFTSKMALAAAAVGVAIKAVATALDYYQQKRRDAVEVDKMNIESLNKVIETRKKEREEIKKSVDALGKYGEKAKLTNEEQVRAALEIEKLNNRGVGGAYVEGDQVVGFDYLKNELQEKNRASQIAELKAQERMIKSQISNQRELVKVSEKQRYSDAFLKTTYVKDAEDAAKAMSALVDQLGELSKERRKLEKESNPKAEKKRISDERKILEARLKDMEKSRSDKDKDSAERNMTEQQKLLELEKEIQAEKTKLKEEEIKISKDKAFQEKWKEAKGSDSYERNQNQLLKDEIRLQERKLELEEKERELKEAKERQNKNFKKHISDQAKSLKIKALENAGLKHQAQLEKALDDAKRAKGADLNDAEKQQVERLVQLQQQLENIPKLNFNGLDIKTNQLTSRGGFKSGAVSTDIDKVNKSIEGYTKQQVVIANQILEEIKNIGG